jgi:transcription termination factor NusB
MKNIRSKKMKSLFDYATKELSQDAFLRWLFENYNSENKEVNKVCEQLFNKFTKNELDFSKIANLTTTAQWKNIDISITHFARIMCD